MTGDGLALEPLMVPLYPQAHIVTAPTYSERALPPPWTALPFLPQAGISR